MADRLAEIEEHLDAAFPRDAWEATEDEGEVRVIVTDLRDLLVVAKAARVLDGLPIPDAAVVVPQADGVVEMPLTWGYLLTDLRAALANFGSPT